jgi:2-keto-4-pentenoate hydratase/2-oxohepta-3-ene-1,7-dioic acid hydratase in catechol pathway
VPLTPGRIPRGTAILTGTPAGVVFRAPGPAFMATHAAAWLATFSFLDEALEDYVKRQWVESLEKSGAFLRPGDVVIGTGRGLGGIVTSITAP